MKHVVVFGANGRVGRAVVKRLTSDGYAVTAFVHRATRFARSETVTVVHGDIHDASAVKKAIKGTDAVISTLGSWGTPTQDILTSGMANIIPAMKKHRIRRIISLTGAEARASGDHLGVIHKVAHLGASLLADKILKDGESHIIQLEQSDLDWTVVRSPVMRANGATNYRFSMTRPFPWATVHRQVVADAMVDQLVETQFIGKAPFISH